MSDYPAYSFLMSVYAKEKPAYLKLSIESMISQSVSADEIVLIKDGLLPEDLNQVINYYSDQNTGLFKLVQLDQNMGLAIALNEGLKNCKNEFIARMDSDDISLPERCELQLIEFIKDPELAIIGTHIDIFSDNPAQVTCSRSVPLSHQEILKFSRRRNPFNHPTVMFKKSVVLEFGGYPILKRNQDFELFTHIVHRYKSKNIDQSLVLFRGNTDNLNRRKSLIKCLGDIGIIFRFWRKGYSRFIDLVIIIIVQIAVSLMPAKVFQIFSQKYLRKQIQ